MDRLTGLNFDEFEEAICGVDGQYTPVGRSTLDWQMHRLALVDMDVMISRNGGGAIYDGACRPDKFGLFFPLSEIESLAVNGEQVQSTTLTWLAAGRSFHIYNSDALDWAGVSVGCEAVNHWLALTHEDFRPELQDHRIGQIGVDRIRQLRDLITRMFDVCGSDPAAWSETAKTTLRSQLSWAIYQAVQSMETERPSALGRPRLSRGEIVERALHLLKTAGGKPVHVMDMCRVTGVSSRTLHSVFMENFGVSPYRFLVLQRLRKIHDALQEADLNDSVAGVCSRFGVWDFGRFSSLYKRIYGVLPSSAIGKKKPSHVYNG